MLKNEYSKKKIERILQQDVEIPEKIENRIQDTYEQLGIGKKVAMKYTRKRRTWAAVAAVAVLAVGMSVVTLAASKFLSANLVENENSVKYDFQVDREKKPIRYLWKRLIYLKGIHCTEKTAHMEISGIMRQMEEPFLLSHIMQRIWIT